MSSLPVPSKSDMSTVFVDLDLSIRVSVPTWPSVSHVGAIVIAMRIVQELVARAYRGLLRARNTTTTEDGEVTLDGNGGQVWKRKVQHRFVARSSTREAK